MTQPAKPSLTRINAGVGGVGSGTGLIAVAQHLGIDTWPGLIALYASPFVAVAMGAVINQMSLWAEWGKERVIVWQARRTCEKILVSPHTSLEHKEKIRKLLEAVSTTDAQNHLARVKAVGK